MISVPKRRILNVLNGPGAIAGGYAVQQGNPADYPYWWLGAPENSKRIFALGPNGNGLGVVSPAQGAANQVVLASYTVPGGFEGVISHIVTAYNGGGFIEGRGDALFTLDVNIPEGSNPPQGTPVQGFSSFSVTLGSFKDGPWPLVRNEVVEEYDEVRLKVINVAAGVGDPNIFVGAILGWIRPLPVVGAQY